MMSPRHGLSERTIELVSRVFDRHPEVEQAVLFGSRAQGTYKSGSDIDLALWGSGLTQKSLNRLYEEFDDLPIPYEFSLVIFDNVKDPDVLAHIKRVGTKFYEKEVVSGKVS
jgi:predicted nucleotidyltransferase